MFKRIIFHFSLIRKNVKRWKISCVFEFAYFFFLHRFLLCLSSFSASARFHFGSISFQILIYNNSAVFCHSHSYLHFTCEKFTRMPQFESHKFIRSSCSRKKNVRLKAKARWKKAVSPLFWCCLAAFLYGWMFYDNCFESPVQVPSSLSASSLLVCISFFFQVTCNIRLHFFMKINVYIQFCHLFFRRVHVC